MIQTKKLKRIGMLLAVVPALFLGSCSNDEEGTEPGGQDDKSEIRFEIGFAPQGGAVNNDDAPETRVATDALFNTTWEDGDQFGLFAVSRASGAVGSLRSSGNYIHNVKLTYSSAGGGTWTTSEDLYFDGANVLDFYAYHPYDVAVTDPTNVAFNVQTDQSGTTDGKSNYNLSDLLTAKAEGVAKTKNAIPLTFSHALSLVQMEFKKDYANNEGPAGQVNVVLQTMRTGATLNLGASSGPEVTVGGEVQSITMLCMENPNDAGNYLYRALVPAQAVAQNANLFKIEQFNELYTHKATALNLTAGTTKRYDINGITFMPTVKISKGTFMMGSSSADPQALNNEKPQHSVTLTNDFYMGKYQVTKAQFAAFLNAVGVGADCKYDVDNEERILFSVNSSGWTPVWDAVSGKWVSQGNTNEKHPDDAPMIRVTWFGAKAYADWVGGSLPTEAQWEYACRAGAAAAYSFGDDVSELDEYGWHFGNYIQGPDRVGAKRSNLWGLYDMHGNVWEWCSNWHDRYGMAPVSDPTGPESGITRMLRGGSWNYDAQFCRSAYRLSNIPGSANSDYGFRVVFVP